MKRVLYIATVDMFTQTGGGIATLSYFNAFKTIFKSRLDLMHAKDYYDMNIGYDNVILQPKPSSLRRCVNLLIGHVHRFYPYLLNYLSMNKDNYELCIINGGVFAGDSITKIKKIGIKVWVIHHNFEREYHISNKTIESFKGLSCFWINKWEKVSYLNADVNLFLTEYDREHFKQAYGCNAGVNYVTGCFEPNEYVFPKNAKDKLNSNILVASGALNYPQSNDSLISFIDEIYSSLSSYDLNFRLLITGRHPSKALKDVSRLHSIDIVDSPKDIFSVIRRGDIYLCPISVGGGLKLRIFDGLKMGLPVIVHINSVRGYECLLGKKYFKTYDSLQSFVESLNTLKKLIDNHDINSQMILKDFYANFSLNSGIKKLSVIYDNLKQ